MSHEIYNKIITPQYHINDDIIEQLHDYILITYDNFNDIPLGSHIKYINLNHQLKSAGFLIKKINNKKLSNKYLIIKSNIIFKLYLINNWIYYKQIKKKTKREIYLELLNSL